MGPPDQEEVDPREGVAPPAVVFATRNRRVRVWGFTACVVPELVEWVAPGGFSDVRSGRDVVNNSGAMATRRRGFRTADCRALASSDIRGNAFWRGRTLDGCPAKAIQCGRGGLLCVASEAGGPEESGPAKAIYAGAFSENGGAPHWVISFSKGRVPYGVRRSCELEGIECGRAHPRLLGRSSSGQTGFGSYG